MSLDDFVCCNICKTEKPAYEFLQTRIPSSKNYYVCHECRQYRQRAYVRKVAGFDARYVYLIDGGNGLYKIGVAIDMEIRFRDIQCMSPVPLTLMLAKIVAEGINCETRIHAHFAKCREHGEWFRLTQEQLQQVIELIGAAELPIDQYQPLR